MVATRPQTENFKNRTNRVTELIVHIIEDNAANRELFQDLMDSVDLPWRSHENAVKFLENFDEESTGCLILDVRMPLMSGLQLMEQLADDEIDLPIILTTTHGDVPMAIQAMKMGAFDFQEKPINNQSLVESVQRALEKRVSALNATDSIAGELEAFETLTARERDVCGLVCNGAMNKQIAYDLGISQRTVEVHRANVMEKMGARNLADLIRMIIRIEESQG